MNPEEYNPEEYFKGLSEQEKLAGSVC